MTRHNDLKPANDDDVFEVGAPLRTGRLDEILGFHLRMANVAIYQDYTAAMGDIGLTQKQFAVLELIAANPKVSQIDIANQLSMDRATMMALVDRLEARGLVVRNRSAIDRRRQELYLTLGGEKVMRKVKARVLEHEARFKRLFEPAELQALLSALEKFRALG